MMEPALFSLQALPSKFGIRVELYLEPICFLELSDIMNTNGAVHTEQTERCL